MAETSEPQSGIEQELPQDAVAQGEGPPQLLATHGHRFVTYRSAIWGVLFCIPVCFWNTWQPVGTIYSLIFSTMAALIVLVAANWVLHRVSPRTAFTTAEMVVIFGIFSVASAASAEWTFLNMQYVHVFAGFTEREPLYGEVFLPHVPSGMYFQDADQVRDYIAGGQGYWYFLTRMDIWLPKIGLWVLLYSCITIALLCVNSLMRDAWLRRERLSFPIIQLPVAMMEGDGRGPLWKSKTMWIAFGIMFAIDMLNGFQYLYPNLPAIPTKAIIPDLRNIFPEQPMRSMGFTPVGLFPFIMALALFMPADLLFSVVFFFFVRKIILVTMAAYGIESGTFAGGFLTPAPPYFSEQTWGAVIGLFATAVWVARRYLREVWHDIVTGAPSKDGGLRHRTAFTLFLMCSSGVLAFMYYGGLSPFIMIPYFLAFVGLSVVIARMRAQLGPPTHEFAFLGPNQLLMNFYGTRNITDRNAVTLGTAFLAINRLHRSHPMPVQLEAMKMADLAGVNQRRMFGLLALGLTAGLFLGSMFFVQRGYVRGADAAWGDPKAIVEGVRNHPSGPSLIGMAMVFVGFAVVTLLDVVRFRFPGFWLHPVGYALSMNFGVDYYWVGLIVALATKTLVQRYYGLKGYRQLRNVAFGILIAEFAAEMIWATMAMITRQSTYTIGINDRGLGMQ